MGYPDRIDGLPRSHRWVTSIASMGYPDRIDGLPRSHRWVTPTASMGYPDRIDGLPRSHRWVTPIASVGYPDRIDGLPRSHRWVTPIASMRSPHPIRWVADTALVPWKRELRNAAAVSTPDGVTYGSRRSERSERPPEPRTGPIFRPRQRSRRQFTPLGI
jgi:hypothetical protein